MADSGRPTTLLTVESDGTITRRKLALERAFVNLMDNADQHGGALVGVTVGRDEAHVRVHVDDAGSGVPVAQRERIFERFATAHTGRRGSAGTGLGLALVDETITAHGGSVWCAERPGGGSRFVLTLPMADHEDAQQGP